MSMPVLTGSAVWITPAPSPSVLNGFLGGQSGNEAIQLQYANVNVTESNFGTPVSGTLTLTNDGQFFADRFDTLEETFDGTQFIHIVTQTASGGEEHFDLDVTTGKFVPSQ